MSDESSWSKRAELRRQGIPSPARPDLPASAESLSDLERSKGDSFSTLNASKRQQLRINFRFRSGYELSLPYSFLVAVAFEPSDGITLDYSGGHRITLSGRGLKKLKRAIDKHTVGTVQEVDEFSEKATADARATAVYRIKREDLA